MTRADRPERRGVLAGLLRERTAGAHTRAERHPVQANLVRGTVTRGEYAAYLEQLRAIWHALDPALEALASRDPRAGAMLQPYHRHAGRLDADLAFLGEPPMGAAPGATRFARLIESAASGTGVLGAWYVMEGSANGGRYIVRAVSRALGIPGPDGLRGLDPHGELQHERWSAWRDALDSQVFSPEEQGGILCAAAASFDAMHDMMDDLVARRGVTSG